MARNLDTSNFLTVPANCETVAFQSKIGESTYAAPITVNNAKRRHPRKYDILNPGMLAQHSMIWHLPGNQLQGYVPKPKDRIIDGAGLQWLIVEDGVEIQSFANRYRCTCNRVGR